MKPVTVFVVDDAPDTRDALGKALRREGFHAVCWSNGWEALQGLENAEPAVVLLDLGMPVMDGLSTLRAIRQDPHWHYLPVLVLSGKDDAGCAAAARSLGASDYLAKGTTPLDDVMKRVHHFAALAVAHPGG